MLAARKDGKVSALVLMATPGVTGAQLVLEQQEHMLQASKLPPEEQKAKIDLQKKIQNAVLTGKGWEGVPPDLRKQADTPWFRSLLAFNPAVVVHDLKQPILVVHGELDRQVFAWQADRLGELARARKGAAANRTVTVVRLPGVNHLLAPATTGEADEYPKLADKNVSKDVLSTVTGWLQKTLAPGRSRQ
jgi:pimeloyl-ACP methyl ester carboxylesterase